jgi:N-methylhydantoinase A
LKEAFAAMEREGRERLGWFDGEVAVRRSADMRYGEQVFEIAVPLDDVDWESPTLAADLEVLFHDRHKTLYTYSLPDQDVVLVNARLSVIGRLPPPSALAGRSEATEARPKGRRRVYLDGWNELPVFAFDALAAGQEVAGPAIVESDTTAVLLRSGDRARFDARGWLDVTVG